jgi:acetyltransferase-like isoleucine patch superfamily enzyme
MKIGKYSYIAFNNLKELFPGMGELTIGNFCSIAEDVVVHLGGDHNPNLISTFPFDLRLNWPVANDTCISKGNVYIGNDVWIGRGVKIMGGVTIGDGSVVGAYSVVAKDIPPYEIWVGNPAKKKSVRFIGETVRKLLEIQWWYWPDEKIKQVSHLLTSDDIDGLLEFYDKEI